jgi:hypothetical protein
MARPKVLKKPSQRRIEKEKRREARRLRRRSSAMIYAGSDSGDYHAWVSNGTGGSGSVTINTFSSNTSSTVTITSPRPTRRWSLPESEIVIESLDEGRTWHTRDTLEPAINRNGELVIGSNPCGRAPEHMREGSGSYSFTIVTRGATDEEARQWYRQRAEESRRFHEEARERAREQSRLWALMADERSRQLIEQAKARERAQARAHALLLSHLTRSQRRDYETRGGFWVWSQFGNLYWVTRHTAIRFDERGVALQRYCIHAIDPNVPAEDNALMRKLVLECDEDRFLRTANGGLPSTYDFMRPASVPVVTIPAGRDTVRPAGGAVQIHAGVQDFHATATGNGGTVFLSSATSVGGADAASGNVVLDGGIFSDDFMPSLAPTAWEMPPELRTDIVLVREEPTAVVLHEDQTPGPDEIVDTDLTLMSAPTSDAWSWGVGAVLLINVNGYVRPLCG